VAAAVRIGTCSWADESLVKHWYPRGVRSGEERLRYYAEHFTTVEIDSTYYRLPERDLVERWAERTPDGFVFHVKAFGMMTRHPVKVETLPPELQEEAEPDERGRVERPSRELRGAVFARFRDALEPFRAVGKLGGILFQFPPYVVPKARSFEYLEWAREQVGEDDMLVEFRHRSWYDDEHRADTLAFLERIGAGHVVVDAPKTDARNVPPTLVATTTPRSYVRFHGRNVETWNVRGRSAAERFDYLYDEGELREWVEPMRELAERADEVYAMFNNNNRSPDPRGSGELVAQAAANAVMFRQVLGEAGLPAA
jgi:uncharacterized protein YecE (DUF72 family)